MALSSLNLSVDMDDGAKAKFIQELVGECMNVLKSNPGNRCAKFCQEYLLESEGNGLDAKGKRD